MAAARGGKSLQDGTSDSKPAAPVPMPANRRSRRLSAKKQQGSRRYDVDPVFVDMAKVPLAHITSLRFCFFSMLVNLVIFIVADNNGVEPNAILV